MAPAVGAGLMFQRLHLISQHLLLALLTLLPTLGIAMYVQMSDEELIRQSDLVVIGELIGQTPLQTGATGERLELGVIRVSETLKGPPGQTVALLLLPAPDAPRASSDLAYKRGDRGLWLLRQRSSSTTGLYLADHPQRFVAESSAARIATLRRQLGRP